jgi:hypothetical protein
MENSNLNLVNKLASSLGDNPILDKDNLNTLVFKYKDLNNKSEELYKQWISDQKPTVLQKYKEVEKIKSNIKSQINEYYNLKNRVNKEILKKKKEKIKVENEKTLTNEKINRGLRNSLLIGGTLGGVILYTLLTKKNLNENL